MMTYHMFQVSVQGGGLRKLFADFRQTVQFLVVYVLEAHARDQWPLGLQHSTIDQHKTLSERIHAAR